MSSELAIQTQRPICDASFIDGVPLSGLPVIQGSEDLLALTLNPSTRTWGTSQFPTTFTARSDTDIYLADGPVHFPFITIPAVFVTPLEDTSRFAMAAGIYSVIAQADTVVMAPNGSGLMAPFINDVRSEGAFFFTQGTLGNVAPGPVIAQVQQIETDGDVLHFGLVQSVGRTDLGPVYLSLEKIG